ncbi:MAG TPA: hypothetical protein VFW40_02995 [Capsulimonadaceae bacterium]|nr:hypothetical protein [Capsulimonadaceae bacterium]
MQPLPFLAEVPNLFEVPTATETYSQPIESSHPDPQVWARFAANDIAARRRKKLTLHLENCAACRTVVAHERQIVRRYRDFEQQAIVGYGR